MGASTAIVLSESYNAEMGKPGSSKGSVGAKGGGRGNGKVGTSGTQGGNSAEASGPRKVPGALAISMPCVFKYLTPETLASAIIGKGGAVIAEIRSSCGVKIGLTDHGELYPQTDCRILTTQANTEEDLNKVSKQIVVKLTDVVKSSGPSEAAGSEGELKLKVLLPRAAAGGVIGKGGASIKELREKSGASISISDAAGTFPAADQVVSISGSSAALTAVLAELNRQIQALNTEHWFSQWATANPTTFAGMASYATSALPGMLSAPPIAALRGSSYSGIATMIQVAQGLPPYVMEDSRGFALSCVVPNRLVGGLIGRGGQGTKEVQKITNTKIGFREIPDDPDNRSLNIAGPLANTCTAYMLMMKRYLDAEAQSTASSGGNASDA